MCDKCADSNGRFNSQFSPKHEGKKKMNEMCSNHVYFTLFQSIFQILLFLHFGQSI